MVDEKRIGDGVGITCRRREARLDAMHEKKISCCMRQKGDCEFGEITDEVNPWHDNERGMGHQVYKGDIALKFEDRLTCHVTNLKTVLKNKVKPSWSCTGTG